MFCKDKSSYELSYSLEVYIDFVFPFKLYFFKKIIIILLNCTNQNIEIPLRFIVDTFCNLSFFSSFTF